MMYELELSDLTSLAVLCCQEMFTTCWVIAPGTANSRDGLSWAGGHLMKPQQALAGRQLEQSHCHLRWTSWAKDPLRTGLLMTPVHLLSSHLPLSKYRHQDLFFMGLPREAYAIPPDRVMYVLHLTEFSIQNG
jgi:hypothetical protein